MQLHLIYAQAHDRVIGKDNALPWHLPEDLAHFKTLTLGCPVIMGRKTWDSLPPRFRPLPGRQNWVVTRQSDWYAQGARKATSLDDALQQCQGHANVWVIGGAQMYALALPKAHSVEVTEIDLRVDGDAFAPPLPAPWHIAKESAHTSVTGIAYRFVTWVQS